MADTDCAPRCFLLRQHAIHVRLVSHDHSWGASWHTWRNGGTAINRAKIYSNRRGIRVSLAQLTETVVKKRTCPKLKEKKISEPCCVCKFSVKTTVISVVHTHTLMGKIPTEIKNTNGNRRPMVVLFVKGQAGPRQLSGPTLPHCDKLWPVSLSWWPNLFPRHHDRNDPRGCRDSRDGERRDTNDPVHTERLSFC